MGFFLPFFVLAFAFIQGGYLIYTFSEFWTDLIYLLNHFLLQIYSIIHSISLLCPECPINTGFAARRYSDNSSNEVVGEPITACGAQNRLMQISYDKNSGGSCELGRLCPPPPLPHPKLRKIHTFWGMEHLHAVWVADAGSFRGVLATNRPRSSECI